MSRHNRVYFSAVLLPILLFVCVSPSLGQENQQESHRQARAWLEFNHHVGGVIVLVLAALTWLEVRKNSAAKAIRVAWPLCLIVIGFYNVMLSDRFVWPIELSTLVEKLSDPEVLQHKILAVMVLALGLIELFRRLSVATSTMWLYLFYGLALLTGGFLLGHDFAGVPHAQSHGLTISHILMGFLALLALVLKVLVDHRLIPGRWACLYPLTLGGLGIQLLLFESSSMMHE